MSLQERRKFLLKQILVQPEMEPIFWAKGRPGFYPFIFTPSKRPTVLALSATTCEQVAVSPETAMGCRRIRFLQAKEGYYYTFSLNKVYLENTELRHTLK